MDRRRFLEITGAVAAVALTGCGGGSSSPPTPTPTPSGPKWSDLASSMQGSLLVPGQDGYAQTAQVLNQRFNAVLPKAIARCASPEDVRAALAFATANNIEITPRCGGHNYAG